MSRQTVQTLALPIMLSLAFALTGVAKALTFTDVTDDAGVALPGVLNESLAWGDYDNDGDQDLYLTNDGPNNLFRNDGNGVFTDITGTAMVGSDAFSVGASFGDLDNDGDLDLFIVNFQRGIDVLYRNDGPVGPGGEYEFTDIAAEAGITEDTSSRGVTLLDYDQDGLLDIFVNALGPDILYHNLGNLEFENVAGTLGVASAGSGVGVVAVDVDNNGWVDIWTANRTDDLNRLYLNTNGTFTDVTADAGIDKVGFGMGIIAFDADNDLDFDLYWTTWPNLNGPQPNAFYFNIDGTSFVDLALASGTADSTGWGISGNAGDVNNDGHEDFFVTNGFSDSTTPSTFFINNGNGTFSDSASVLANLPFDARGVAFADYDQDGDMDLCVTGGPNHTTRLWRNDTNSANHWVSFNLIGTCSNRTAIGARIEVETDLGAQVKEVSGGAGRGSQNSLPVEFGLGLANSIVEVRIRWPNGTEQALPSLEMDRFHRLVEPPCDPASADGLLGSLSGLRLFPARPNPMTLETTIAFQLNQTDHVTLGVYDTGGRLVRSLVSMTLPADHHVLTWDGRDEQGRDVGTGAYFVRLQRKAELRTQKILLLK